MVLVWITCFLGKFANPLLCVAGSLCKFVVLREVKLGICLIREKRGWESVTWFCPITFDMTMRTATKWMLTDIVVYTVSLRINIKQFCMDCRYCSSNYATLILILSCRLSLHRHSPNFNEITRSSFGSFFHCQGADCRWKWKWLHINIIELRNDCICMVLNHI